jgi:hypothetical protein
MSEMGILQELVVYNSVAAKRAKNDCPIPSVRDRNSPRFDLLGTEQD